ARSGAVGAQPARRDQRRAERRRRRAVGRGRPQGGRTRGLPPRGKRADLARAEADLRQRHARGAHAQDLPQGAAAQDERTRPARGELMGASILIVDDEKNILVTLSRALRVEGYEVDVAGSGQLGLEKAKTKSYDA